MFKKSCERPIASAPLSTMILGLLIFFSSFLCSLGYYQHPEVVQFTTVPDDTVVCQGCRLEMSCSILRQNTTADLPQPELEWLFNGSRMTFHDIRTRTHTTVTHVSIDLIIDIATAHHSGIYQCRAMDGNNSTVCRDNSIPCVPTTTISRPARIQIVGDPITTEAVSIGSSCSGVVVLPCGSRLMQGTSLQTPSLTWRRNGEELTPDLDSEVVLLSSGDLAINTSSSETGDYYECVAFFINDGRNVTLARYRMASPHGDGGGSWIQDEADRSDYLRLTSSRVVVFEGAGSVEFVCEASVRGEGGVCVPYNVTWRSSDGPLLPATDSDTSLAFNNHLLRVGGVSNSSQYCCQVHATGGRTMEECTTVHVVPQHDSQAVDSKTIFLKNESESNITEISCSRLFSGGDTGNYTWYHNGELMEGFYSSSLTLSRDGSVLTDNVFGVYQCFSNDGVRTVREVNLVRVLPYGMTNPPGNLVLTELPYPNPNPTEALFYGTYLVDWSPPVFTGGLTQLHYNVTVSIFFNGVLVLSTNITSVMIYMRDYVNVRIKVTTIDRIAAQRISEDSPEFHNLSIRNWCAGEVLYPPAPSLSCKGGLANLYWETDPANGGLFIDGNGGTELHYVNGTCTHINGSTDLYHRELEEMSHHIFYEEGAAVGTHCQFAMGSAKRKRQGCDEDCFCYNTTLIMYSHPVECYVQGSARFVNSTYQVFENDGSIQVCVRVEGYGFAVNVSAAENNITSSISHRLDFSSSLPNILCVNISIMNDNIIEGTKVFNISLTTNNELVTVGEPAVVQVIDNDYAVVHFAQSFYTVSEGEGSLRVCASIDVESEVSIAATVYSEDGSAHADNDYAPVNETLLFTPESDPVQCFNISIFDDNITESDKVFTLSVATGDRISQVTTTTVKILDNDVIDPQEFVKHLNIGAILGAVFGFTVFLIILIVAGSISCLVILVKRKRQLQNSYKIPQDDIGSIDWSMEPAVLISAENPYFHIKRYSASDFDSKTLLDYLGPTTAELDTPVPPLQILSTKRDTMDNDSPLQVTDEKQLESRHTDKQRMNCYNVSVESGVVLDLESLVNVRKISTGSGSCSHGSLHDIEHSYIGMANTYMCACTECRLQRERLYSRRVGWGTLEHVSQSNELNNDSTTLDDEQLNDNDEHTTDVKLRDTELSSHSHEMDSNTDNDITERTNNADALHSTSLNQNVVSEPPTHVQASDSTC